MPPRQTHPRKSPRPPPPDAAPPKPPRIRQLERLIARIDALATHPPTRDPAGGCFCQARMHPLSAHTPLCPACGLVLCSLNHPFHLCPSSRCPSPNLLPSTQHRANLLSNLRHQLSAEMQKEDDLKLKLAQEEKKQAGAFPSLQPSSATNPKTAPRQATHKVLSITSSSQSKKNKKIVTLSTSAQPSPSSSAPPSRNESPSLDPGIPEPPSSVIHSHSPPSSRPWRNFTRDTDIKYIPPNP